MIDVGLEPLPLVRLLRQGPSRRRKVAAGAALVAGLPVLTAVLDALTDQLHLPSQLLVYVAAVVAISALGGTLAGLAAAVVAFVLANWFFIEPAHTLKIADPEDAVALGVFLVVAATVSSLVSIAAARAAEARRLRNEADVIARAASTLVSLDEPVPALVGFVRAMCHAEAVVLEGRHASGWTMVAVAGEVQDGGAEMVVDPDHRLRVIGAAALDPTGSVRVLVRQLGTALQARRLRDEADAALERAAGDAFRTALLRAVSHDLRTPLTSVKTAVSSLLSSEVEWSPEHTTEFLELIDTETDRLDRLIGNLLDMSRLEAGAVQARLAPVRLDEVTATAVASLGQLDGAAIVEDIPGDLGLVAADEVLLERALANLLANAVRYGGGQIQVTARPVNDALVGLHVVDHGPGIAATERTQAFAPFTQVSGRHHSGGFGLGLAIAHGFVQTMGGDLTLTDTPGGGLTVSMRLPWWR